MKHYKILDIPITSTIEEIKIAYRKKAKIMHPDLGGDENEFKELNEAYSTLSDIDKRKKYDNEHLYRQNRNLDVYDIHNILLKDVYFGKSYKINKNGYIIDLNIPKGIQNGTVIKIDGKGMKDGDRIGDLYIKIYILESVDIIHLGMLDLEVTCKIDLNDLLYRHPYKLKLWDEDICTVNIPSAFSSNSVLKLKGYGLKHSMFNTVGDLYLKFKVDYPHIKESE